MGRVLCLQQPPGERLKIINYAQLWGRELVAKLDLLIRLARAIYETQETDPDLAVAIIRLRAQLDLNRTLPNPRLLNEAVKAYLIELIDAMGRDRVDRSLDQSFHAKLDGYENWLGHRVWQEGELRNF